MFLNRCLVALVLCPAILCAAGGVTTAPAQQQRRASSPAEDRGRAGMGPRLTGVYRIDTASSDQLYSVVAGASSNLPFGEQQRFFIDLAVRLAPPDLLAIEQRGRSFTIASSRAPRVSFEADGQAHRERSSDGNVVRTRALFRGDQLTVNVAGGGDDDFTVTFDPIDSGRRLRVTRRISAEQLNQPVVIQSVYEKVSDVARWSIVDEPTGEPAERAAAADSSAPSVRPAPGTSGAGRNAAAILRRALDDWINATNARNIGRQMNFYMPTLKAFYLARNVPRSSVRAEKARIFSNAQAVDVRAEAPEIIFLDSGRTAIMRFRKRYAVEGRQRSRRGEVIQELRWQRTGEGWKIFSERDVKVIR